MDAPKLRLLIAEDHAVVRDGLEALLTYQGFEIVAAVGRGDDAIEKFAELRPDVVLLDLRMPGLGGVDATAAIRALDSNARILILTTYSGDEDIFRALNAGAKGYLLKDASTEKLVQAIQAVAEGRSAVGADVASRLAERSMGPSLTPREREVLQRIALGRSNKEIAADLMIGEGTIKTHVNSLLEKLGVSDRTEAVVTGLRRGLIHLER
jgi:DNA-binding NarL/FixJ family response regulator